MQETQEYDALINRLTMNHGSSEPYYLQLKRKITYLIENGNLMLGANLPSERLLAETLKVSRTTIRRCYEELRQEGFLEANGRNGTSIGHVAQINPILGKLKGFTEEMRELGIIASTYLESSRTIQDRMIASIFNRPAATNFLRLVRIRHGDNIPMTREVAWYDLSLAPKLSTWDGSGSIYEYLSKNCDIKLDCAEQAIEAIVSSDIESHVFNFEEPGPCLLLKRKSYSIKNQLVEYVEGTFRGDIYTYRINLKV